MANPGARARDPNESAITFSNAVARLVAMVPGVRELGEEQAWWDPDLAYTTIGGLCMWLLQRIDAGAVDDDQVLQSVRFLDALGASTDAAAIDLFGIEVLEPLGTAEQWAFFRQRLSGPARALLDRHARRGGGMWGA